MAKLDVIPLKQPIAIRPEHIATSTTSLRVTQHKSLSSADFTISTSPDTPTSSATPSPTNLFSVDGHIASWRQRRHFRDASGLPLFELTRKSAGVTWYVKLPGDDTDAQPIATIATRSSVLKDKFDVHLLNAAANAEEVVLEVRGQDVWKLRTNVYVNGAMVMTAKRTDKLSAYVPGKTLEWDVDVAEGLDVSLASVIVVLLGVLMYQSSYPSSFSGEEADSKAS